MRALSRFFSRKKPFLSGYMIVRDVVDQGYPYLEAIRSALPVCDEFLISDGFSSDATWEGLEALRVRFPDKIRLFRDSWEGGTNHGEILAAMSNRLRERCGGAYCLNLQANEIIPRVSLEQIARLPLLYPKIDLFRLPFDTVMGRRLHWMVDFRNRLFRNDSDIVSLGDAYDVGWKPGVQRPACLDQWTVHLPLPVRRYRGLFPVNYIRKHENRLRLFQSPRSQHFTRKEVDFARRLLAQLQSTALPEAFWREIQRYFDERMWQDNPGDYQPGPNIPRKMSGFQNDQDGQLDHLSDLWEYDFRESLKAVERPADVVVSL
jgi:hypothetical protein